MSLLEVQDLHTSFFTDAGEVKAVNGVSFFLDKGKVLGIVGESGSGKSVTAYSIMQILASTGKIVSGSIKLDGQELVGAGEDVMKHVRGNKVSIIFQDPMTSLNPTYTIGHQLMEAITLHTDRNRKQAWDRAVEMLRLVNVNEPEKRMKQYPYRVLRRHAPARHDRHGAGLRARYPDRRRAHHRARRHHPGADPGPHEVPAEGARHGDHPHHATILASWPRCATRSSSCTPAPSVSRARRTRSSTIPATNTPRASCARIPSASNVGEKLEPIHGTPIDLLNMPAGCPFAPRCEAAMKICLRERAERMRINEDHLASCWMNVKKGLEDGSIELAEDKDAERKDGADA